MKKEAIILLLILVIAGCQTQVVCNKPYIIVGTSCCLDQNDNLICDEHENTLDIFKENKTESNTITANVVVKTKEQILEEKLAEINKNITDSNDVIKNLTAAQEAAKINQTKSIVDDTPSSSLSSSSSSSSDSTSQAETPAETQTTSGDPDCVTLGCPEGTTYVGSVNSDKYHRCGCRWAKEIHTDNLNCFTDKADAESDNYIPCSVCDP